MSKVTLRPRGDIVRTADIKDQEQYEDIARAFILAGADDVGEVGDFTWMQWAYLGVDSDDYLVHWDDVDCFGNPKDIRILTPDEVLGAYTRDPEPAGGNATYTCDGLFITVDSEGVTIDRLDDDGAVCLTHEQLDKVFDVAPGLREIVEGE